MRIATVTVVLSMALVSASTASAAQSAQQPKLHFDSQGRLVMVTTQDGKQCVFQYDKGGAPLPSADPTCGTPSDWVKSSTPK